MPSDFPVCTTSPNAIGIYYVRTRAATAPVTAPPPRTCTRLLVRSQKHIVRSGRTPRNRKKGPLSEEAGRRVGPHPKKADSVSVCHQQRLCLVETYVSKDQPFTPPSRDPETSTYAELTKQPAGRPSNHPNPPPPPPTHTRPQASSTAPLQRKHPKRTGVIGAGRGRTRPNMANGRRGRAWIKGGGMGREQR